jgi:tetratricopeptide repeat protein 30
MLKHTLVYWKLLFALQETKFKDAIRYYDPIVKKHADDILSVTAIVLANLCVSYIMTSQNEEAEELMRRIEKEEERLAYSDPDKPSFHLCIVNLVIGTLYCAKGNFEFGVSRVMKSLEPYDKKLGTDTWYYAKVRNSSNSKVSLLFLQCNTTCCTIL